MNRVQPISRVSEFKGASKNDFELVALLTGTGVFISFFRGQHLSLTRKELQKN